MTNEWTNPAHSAAYLARMHKIPHRAAGESTLLSEIPANSKRVLDLGCGDGHLLHLVLNHCQDATGIGLDLSTEMIDQAKRRFLHDQRVSFVQHNMDAGLPALGDFDCIVSSFAIHHCSDDQKQELYAQIYSMLQPGGIFCNLEHVSSPNERIHFRFVSAMNMTAEGEDPSNRLLDTETQLGWLRDLGFEDVDCYWKWRELALLIGIKPLAGHPADSTVIDLDPTPAEVSLLDEQLGNFNKLQTGRDDFHPLNLVVRSNGNVIAGLKATTGWDWLYVQILWVDERHRRDGIGSKLIERAEQIAVERGCIGSCLSSYNFQAPEFYEQHGFTTFGQIDDYPVGNKMFFMLKRYAG